MVVQAVLLLSGLIGASFCQHLTSGGTWAVDSEQTENMNLDGITFFHENQNTNHNTEGSNNNSKLQTLNDKVKPMFAFSHFMPDQSKLSRTAGLSRAANKSPANVKDEFDKLTSFYRSTGSAAKRNKLLNFATTDNVQAPSTSEVMGFESGNNQIPQSFVRSGSERNSAMLRGNDVLMNENVQQINLSQLGIMKENVGNTRSTIKEIDYFNAGTNDFTAGNTLTNAGVVNNRFLTDNTGSRNEIDNTQTMENSINKNNYIFGSTFDSTDTGMGSSSQVESSLATKKFQSDNKALGKNNFSLKTSSVPSLTNAVSNGKTEINNLGSTLNENVLRNGERKDNIVKHFPFGQLQGSPKKINKRLPTLKAKKDFVDHSRTPILKVKSAFVDLSGRQNPIMKPLGTFVDMSDKFSTKLATTVKTTSKPMSTAKTTSAKTTVEPNPTNPSPETTRPGPALTGLALPGVISVNSPSTVNNGKNAEGSISNGSSLRPKETVSVDSINTKTENSGKTIPPGDNLRVDMLYPPAPFPADDQFKLVTNSGQAVSNQPNQGIAAVPDTDSISSNEVTGVKSSDVIDYLDSTVGTGNSAGDITETFDYDYDMYADNSIDVSDLSQNGKSQSNVKDASKKDNQIPLVNRNTGVNDHFITDPNVQIINPNNKIVPNNVQTIPSNQNIRTRQTGPQNIGRFNNFQTTNQNMFPNAGQNIATNNRLGPMNGQTPSNNNNEVVNKIQTSIVPGSITSNNGQRAGNNILNQNQFRNGLTIQNNFPQSTKRSNVQSNSLNLMNNQNFITQNGFNSNPVNRLQQNVNNFPNNVNIPNGNEIQNGRTNQNIVQTLSSGQVNPAINTGNFVSANMLNAKNRQGQITPNNQIQNIRPVQSNINNMPMGNQIPSSPPNIKNNERVSPSNQLAPSQIRTVPTNIQRKQNQNNLMNSAVNPSNGQNTNNLMNNGFIPSNGQNTNNLMNSAVNPSNGQNTNNLMNSAVNPSNGQNTNNLMNSAVNPSNRQNINNLMNIAVNPSNGQNTNNFNSQIDQISTRPIRRNNMPNMNLANQINDRVSLNSLGQPNLNSLNVNNVPQNGNFNSLPNTNAFTKNFQNGPIVNSQTATMNNFPRNLNTLPNNGNGLPNMRNNGENINTNFQIRNNLAGPQFRNTQQNAIGSSNGIQQFGQNNANIAQNVVQNGQNGFENRQQLPFGNIPNNLRNVLSNMPTFQGNTPQNQNNLPNNFLRGDFQNGLTNNFRPNMVNTFPVNVPFNTNRFGPNVRNGPFGPFK